MDWTSTWEGSAQGKSSRAPAQAQEGRPQAKLEKRLWEGTWSCLQSEPMLPGNTQVAVREAASAWAGGAEREGAPGLSGAHTPTTDSPRMVSAPKSGFLDNTPC